MLPLIRNVKAINVQPIKYLSKKLTPLSTTPITPSDDRPRRTYHEPPVYKPNLFFAPPTFKVPYFKSMRRTFTRKVADKKKPNKREVLVEKPVLKPEGGKKKLKERFVRKLHISRSAPQLEKPPTTIKTIVEMNDKARFKQPERSIAVKQSDNNKVKFHYLGENTECRQCLSKQRQKFSDFFKKNAGKLGTFGKGRTFSTYTYEGVPTLNKNRTITVRDEPYLDKQSVSLFSLIKQQSHKKDDFVPTNRYRFESKKIMDQYTELERRRNLPPDPYPLDMFYEDYMPPFTPQVVTSCPQFPRKFGSAVKLHPCGGCDREQTCPDRDKKKSDRKKEKNKDKKDKDKRRPKAFMAGYLEPDDGKVWNFCKKSPAFYQDHATGFGPSKKLPVATRNTFIPTSEMGRFPCKPTPPWPKHQVKVKIPREEKRDKNRKCKRQDREQFNTGHLELAVDETGTYGLELSKKHCPCTGGVRQDKCRIKTPPKKEDDLPEHCPREVHRKPCRESPCKQTPKKSAAEAELKAPQEAEFEVLGAVPRVELTEAATQVISMDLRKIIEPVIERECKKYQQVRDAVERMERKLDGALKRLESTPLKYPWKIIREQTENPRQQDPLVNIIHHKDPLNRAKITEKPLETTMDDPSNHPKAFFDECPEDLYKKFKKTSVGDNISNKIDRFDPTSCDAPQANPCKNKPPQDTCCQPTYVSKVDPCSATCGQKPEPACGPPPCGSPQAGARHGEMKAGEVRCKVSPVMPSPCQDHVVCDDKEIKGGVVQCGKSKVLELRRKVPQEAGVRVDCDAKCPEVSQPECFQAPCPTCEEVKSVPVVPVDCTKKPSHAHGIAGMIEPVKCDYTKNEQCPKCPKCPPPVTPKVLFSQPAPRKSEPCDPNQETVCPVSCRKQPITGKTTCEKNDRYCDDAAKQIENEKRLAELERIHKQQLAMACQKPVQFKPESKKTWTPVKIQDDKMGDKNATKPDKKCCQINPKIIMKMAPPLEEDGLSSTAAPNYMGSSSEDLYLTITRRLIGQIAAPIVVTFSRNNPIMNLRAPGQASADDNFNGKRKKDDGFIGVPVEDKIEDGKVCQEDVKPIKSKFIPTIIYRNNIPPHNQTKNVKELESCISKLIETPKKPALETNTMEPCLVEDKPNSQNTVLCPENTTKHIPAKNYLMDDNPNQNEVLSAKNCDTEQNKRIIPTKNPCIPCKYENYDKKAKKGSGLDEKDRNLGECVKKRRSKPQIHEDDSCVDKGKKKDDPCKKKEDPCKKKEDPCKKKEDPCKKKEDPCKKKEDPCKKKEDPCKKKEAPGKPKDDPCKKKEDPCKKKDDACKPKDDPCKKKEDPCKKKEAPVKPTDDPCKKKEDHGKTKEDPCKKKDDPCKPKQDSGQKDEPCKPKKFPFKPPKKEYKCDGKPETLQEPKKILLNLESNPISKICISQKDNPCIEKPKDPCWKHGDPCQIRKKKKQDDTCGHKQDPLNREKDPCKKQQDPCAKKEDPCKKQEDPCAKKRDSSKKKKKNPPCNDLVKKCATEDPCAKKEDPCEKEEQHCDEPSENQCKKKEDSSKPKEDPCKKEKGPSKKRNVPCNPLVKKCSSHQFSDCMAKLATTQMPKICKNPMNKPLTNNMPSKIGFKDKYPWNTKPKLAECKLTRFAKNKATIPPKCGQTIVATHQSNLCNSVKTCSLADKLLEKFNEMNKNICIPDDHCKIKQKLIKVQPNKRSDPCQLGTNPYYLSEKLNHIGPLISMTSGKNIQKATIHIALKLNRLNDDGYGEKTSMDLFPKRKVPKTIMEFCLEKRKMELEQQVMQIKWNEVDSETKPPKEESELKKKPLWNCFKRCKSTSKKPDEEKSEEPKCTDTMPKSDEIPAPEQTSTGKVDRQRAIDYYNKLMSIKFKMNVVDQINQCAENLQKGAVKKQSAGPVAKPKEPGTAIKVIPNLPSQKKRFTTQDYLKLKCFSGNAKQTRESNCSEPDTPTPYFVANTCPKQDKEKCPLKPSEIIQNYGRQEANKLNPLIEKCRSETLKQQQEKVCTNDEVIKLDEKDKILEECVKKLSTSQIQKDDVCQMKSGDPCKKQKDDPCKQKEDPCKKKEDPCKPKDDPCKKKEDPCKKKEDPCKPKDDPCKKKEDPCKKKEDPCKPKDDPCKKKEDPCKKKEDPCKPKDDPCKKKEDPCKPKDNPCKKKEDKKKPKDDPCKKKEDPCKPKDNPCKKKEDKNKTKDDPCLKLPIIRKCQQDCPENQMMADGVVQISIDKPFKLVDICDQVKVIMARPKSALCPEEQIRPMEQIIAKEVEVLAEVEPEEQSDTCEPMENCVKDQSLQKGVKNLTTNVPGHDQCVVKDMGLLKQCSCISKDRKKPIIQQQEIAKDMCERPKYVCKVQRMGLSEKLICGPQITDTYKPNFDEENVDRILKCVIIKDKKNGERFVCTEILPDHVQNLQKNHLKPIPKIKVISNKMVCRSLSPKPGPENQICAVAVVEEIKTPRTRQRPKSVDKSKLCFGKNRKK